MELEPEPEPGLEPEPEPEPLAESEPAATWAEIGSSSTHSGDEESAADFSLDERFELDSSCFDSGSESDEGTTAPCIPVTQEDLERIERELSLAEQAAVLAQKERTKELLQKQKQKQKQAMEALGPASTKRTPNRQDPDEQWAQRWAKAGQAGKCDICGGGIGDLSVGALTMHAKGKKHQKAKAATAATAAKAPQTIAPTTTGTSALQDDAQAVLTRLKDKFGADTKQWPIKKTKIVGAAGDQYNKTADLKSVVTQLKASGIVSGKGTKKHPFTWHIGSDQTETAVTFGIPAATATSAPTKGSGPKAGGRHRGTVRRLHREMMIGEIMWTMPGGAGVSRAFMHENACQPGTWDALQNGCAVEFKAVEQSGKPQPYRAVAIEFVSLEAASAPATGWSSSAATTSSSAAARPALKLATSERPQATLDELLDDDDDVEEDDASPPPELEGAETCFCAILYSQTQMFAKTNVGAVGNRAFPQG
jgi:hypothetical protein